LTEKAHKQNIREIHEKLDDYLRFETLIDYKAENNQRFMDMIDKLAKIDETIDALGQNISREIYSAVKRVTMHLNKNIPTGSMGAVFAGPNGNVFNPSEVELRKAIEAKADKADLIEINNLKSNKMDTENTLRWIDLLHKQIKHIAVLLVEGTKSLLKNPNETKQ
jgi:hypothetical protein